MSFSSKTPPASSRGQHSEEIPKFPAHKGERYRSIRPVHADDEVISVDDKPSQGEPDCQIPEVGGTSDHRLEPAARSIFGPSGRMPPIGKGCDTDEAYGQRRQAVGATKLEAWPRMPGTGEGDCFDSLFWSPFGSAGISIGDGAHNTGSEEGPRAQILSPFFHLECTNFVAKSTVGTLSLSVLQDALQKTLSQTNVDILEFVSCHSVYKCSYHEGNSYMTLFVRVFQPPPISLGQLLHEDTTIAEKIEGGLLVEVQLREGDRLHFSTLFREILINFSKIHDTIVLMGTLRYKPRPFPEKGEGLSFERIDNLEPSRFRIGQVQDSANELPSPITSESMDEDMIDDVLKLVEVLEAGLLDAQADAATAIAGLTSEAEFRDQLADPGAKEAADALCRASARVLAETKYRPARRQAAVIVANLASVPALCRCLLESDPPLTSLRSGIVDTLVTLAMLRSVEEKEEEIGTRRECIRALISLAESRSTRNMPAMKSLRSTTPSGRGAKCTKLMERLRMCRDVLARPATVG